MKDNSFQLYNKPAFKNFTMYELLLDSLPAMVLVTDKNDRLVFVNKNFRRLIDHHFSDANISMKEIIARGDWDNWNENLFKLSNLNDEDNCVFNIRFRKNVSDERYFKLDAKVFQRDEHRKPSLYLFIAEDVTEQFHHENTTSTNENLHLNWKNFVSKSSIEKKLELTVKDLDRSNKDLEEFAYVASHDLQEPLRKIISFSTRLAFKYGEQLGSEGNLYIDKINAAAESMRNLIENLLQISRTVQHSQPFVLTDLNKIFSDVKQTLDLKIEEGHVQITQEPLPVVEALPSLITQVFNNLLSNAIKFSSKNQSAIINITSHPIKSNEKKSLQLAANNEYYKICIKDNGVGFSQEQAENIFKIFFRLNNKTDYPGTGLGLAICKKIIEKHCGLIWAESEPGKGASFFIVLPKTQD